MRELRQNLSVYLRRVRNGEALEVTERGQPVARLQPLLDPDDAAARLEARGLTVRRGRGPLANLPAPLKLDFDRPASEILDDLREDRL